MAGFAYGVGGRVQPQQPNVNAKFSMAAPHDGHGLHCNAGEQNIEGMTRQFGTSNGQGVGRNLYSLPAVQRQYYYRPYNNSYSSASSARVKTGCIPYYYNSGTQTIQGEMVQSGTFNGRAMGARIYGPFSVSGDIN